MSERELAERSEIPTDFGEVLSWRYLTYVREHPVVWHVRRPASCTARGMNSHPSKLYRRSPGGSAPN
ncbi:MAG: hypothetical protein V8T53_00595 [Eubacteriales bacterium]